MYIAIIQVIQYIDNFLVIINHEPFIPLIQNKVKAFLNLRGLSINKSTIATYTERHKTKFKYLGYEFIHLKNSIRINYKNRFAVRNGLKSKFSHKNKVIVFARSG